MQDHVACDESDDGIWVGRAVIQELCEGFHCFLGAVCLLGGERADGGKEG